MVLKFEEGWSSLQKSITEVIRIIEEEPEPAFKPQLGVNLYTTIYDMCTQKPDYSQQLYDKYCVVIEDYTIQTVLPSLKEKHAECMLRELVKRWNNHKILVTWLTNIFRYIERYLVPRTNIPSLDKVGLTCFLDLVYSEMQSTATKAVVALIHKEREGEEIDRTLVKNVLDVNVDNGIGTIEKYEKDFESFML